MTLDKEVEVAVEAVKLVTSILKYHPDILSEKVSLILLNNTQQEPIKELALDYLFIFTQIYSTFFLQDCEHIYELVYSSHRLVGQAAGEFLKEKFFLPDEEPQADLRTKRGKTR